MALPLIGSGYFDTLANSNFDLSRNIGQRNLAFSQFLADLGMRQNRKGALVVDRNNPDGAWQEGSRAATYNAADRGFGSQGSMRALAFQPLRNQITRKARRELVNTQYENKMDRLERQKILAQASQDAARYGYQNKLPSQGR